VADELLPGIQRIAFGPVVSAYLLTGAEVPILVDTGLPGRADRIMGVAAQVGPGVVIGHVAVTHGHPDHVGSLAAVVAGTGAEVHMHAADAPIVRDGAPQPAAIPSTWLAAALIRLFGRGSDRDIEQTAVHHEVADGDELPGGLRVIGTPGHTPGHVSYLWPERGGVLFVGDALARPLGRLGLGTVNSDPSTAVASAAKLAELEFAVACFGHGGPLRGRPAANFRRTVERLARRHR
jgi:glyoxylase-like metal-dependent hydrolase (beta-lactamase superfamily II)